jgi:prepilin-type N-terminal cleavage/methylation domain-containing protein
MFVKNKKYKGFSLIEMIVAIFVFSLIMVIVIGTFISVVNLRKKTKTIQQNTENAHFVMEQMAKTLRTSSILESTETSIQAFDYSQTQCIRYNYNADLHTLQSEIGTGSSSECTFTDNDYVDMTSSAIGAASFVAVKSDSDTRGKVTIALKVCYDSNDCTGVDRVNIQTTVSLRDYEE